MLSAISIILSLLSLLVAGGSLYVAYRAFQRSGSDRRLRLRQSARELGVFLDDAISKLAQARQSRPRVLSMEGLALSGNAKVFEQEATTDDADLKEMLARARANFGEIDPRISDAAIETKLVDLNGMRARAEQIRDKYVAALAEDDQKRAEKRQAMYDLGNRLRTERTPGSGSGP